MKKKRINSKIFFLFLLLPLILILVGVVLVYGLNLENEELELQLARKYAPDFWFDSEEEYYPCDYSEFYYDENGNERSADEAVFEYKKLSKENKLNRFKVFYKVLWKEDSIVIEYWLFYVFNDFSFLGGRGNQHYGDAEYVFIFLDKNTESIQKVIASEHIGEKTKIFLTHALLNKPTTDHIRILVEKGSHANWIDGNQDGLVSKIGDVSNWYQSYGSFLFTEWNEEDKIYGVKMTHDDENYQLVPLAFLERKIIEKKFSRVKRLGVSVFGFYLPIGGEPSDLASIQDKVENPEKVEPITGEFVKREAENKIRGFTDNLKQKITEFKKYFSSFSSFQEATISQFSENKQNEKTQEEKSLKDKKEETKQTEEFFEKENQEESLERKEKNKTNIEEKEELRKKEIEEIERKAREILKKLSLLNNQLLSLEKSQFILEQKEEQKKEIDKKSSYIIPPFFSGVFLDNNPPLISLNYSLDGFTIFLSWQGEDESGISNYDVEYRKENKDWQILLNDTQETETTFLGENGETFYFRVRAEDIFGNLSNWQEISVKFEKISEHLVINRLQISPSEYVELYNPTEKEITLTNFYFAYYPVDEKCQEDIENCRNWSDPWLIKKFPEGEIIEAKSFYLIKVGEDEREENLIKADWQFKNETGEPFSPKLSDKFGTIAIFPFNPKEASEEELKENYIDIFSWGFSQKVKEGSPFVSFNQEDVSKKIFIRKKDGLDTDDNSKDFVLSSEKEFRNSKRLSVWIDNFLPEDEFLVLKPKFTLFWESIDPKLDYYKIDYKIEGGNWVNFYEGKEKSKEFVSKRDFVIYSFKVIAFDKEGKISKEKEIKLNLSSLPISFNEIMYDPKDPDDFCEYIEIFNNTSLPINLSRWKLKIKNKELFLESFNDSPPILPPQKFALVGDDEKNLFNSPDCSYQLPEGVLKLVVKEANLTLPNKGQGSIEILDSKGRSIDFVLYGNWWGANGDGNSLQKPKPTHYSYLENNWQAVSPTPGFENENFDQNSFNTIDSSFTYKIFSSDNDLYILSKKVSPYLIKSQFKIPQGKTLVVEPEVKLFFDSGKFPGSYGRLFVEGVLEALGEKDKEILFDCSNENSFWGGISFENGSSGLLKFVKIFKAGRTNVSDVSYMFKDGQSILIRKAEVSLENVILERNKYSGIVIEEATPKIKNLKIYPKEGETPLKYSAAIYIERANPEIRESEIFGNSYGIYIINHSFPDIEETFFKENKFPLYVKDYSFPLISKNEFQENELNGIIFSNSLPSGEITFQKEKFPYIIDGNLSISKDTTLIISPGVIIKFNITSDPYNKSSISVEGKLIAQGNEESPIVFTSVRDDLKEIKNIKGESLENYFSDTNSDGEESFPSPGGWKGIFFKEGSEGILDNVILRYGGQGGWSFPAGYVIRVGALDIEKGNLILRNSIFENNLMAGIYLKDTNLFLENIIFRNHNLLFGYNKESSAGLRIKNSSPILKDCSFENNSVDIFEESGNCQNLLEILNNCQNCHFEEGGKFFPSYCP